jgi:hypothetical protein
MAGLQVQKLGEKLFVIGSGSLPFKKNPQRIRSADHFPLDLKTTALAQNSKLARKVGQLLSEPSRLEALDKPKNLKNCPIC